MTILKCTTPGPKIDETGALVKIADDGLVCIDKLRACRRILRNGVIYIQFCEDDRLHIALRGTKFVEIPLSVLCEVLSMGQDWQEESVDA